MPRYAYKIGTVAAGVGAMTNVESLVPNTVCPPPEGLAVERFSVYREAANGIMYGDGYPRTSWRFRVIQQPQLDALLAYIGAANQSATVLIATKGDDAAYTNYQAVMHRPKPGEDMTPAFSGNWHDVTIRFTMLETP